MFVTSNALDQIDTNRVVLELKSEIALLRSDGRFSDWSRSNSIHIAKWYVAWVPACFDFTFTYQESWDPQDIVRRSEVTSRQAD